MVYALFPPIMMNRKAESANFFAFRMYAVKAQTSLSHFHNTHYGKIQILVPHKYKVISVQNQIYMHVQMTKILQILVAQKGSRNHVVTN